MSRAIASRASTARFRRPLDFQLVGIVLLDPIVIRQVSAILRACLRGIIPRWEAATDNLGRSAEATFVIAAARLAPHEHPKFFHRSTRFKAVDIRIAAARTPRCSMDNLDEFPMNTGSTGGNMEPRVVSPHHSVSAFLRRA